MKCARSACNNDPAPCQHTQTGKMYCVSCAHKINEFFKNKFPHDPELIIIPTEEEDCPSYLGGFVPDEEADGGRRKCLDCRGTGKVL